MKNLLRCVILVSALMSMGTHVAAAQIDRTQTDTTQIKRSRLTLGGYGEAVASRMF